MPATAEGGGLDCEWLGARWATSLCLPFDSDERLQHLDLQPFLLLLVQAAVLDLEEVKEDRVVVFAFGRFVLRLMLALLRRMTAGGRAILFVVVVVFLGGPEIESFREVVQAFERTTMGLEHSIREQKPLGLCSHI